MNNADMPASPISVSSTGGNLCSSDYCKGNRLHKHKREESKANENIQSI